MALQKFLYINMQIELFNDLMANDRQYDTDNFIYLSNLCVNC